jgi:hypothetical protein
VSNRKKTLRSINVPVTEAKPRKIMENSKPPEVESAGRSGVSTRPLPTEKRKKKKLIYLDYCNA